MNHTKEHLLLENDRLRRRLAEEQQKARKMETRCYCWWCRVVDKVRKRKTEETFFTKEMP